MSTQAISTETLLQQLNWRYATKQFDATRRIPTATWETLEQALILTPSSYGLAPYRFIVVTDPDVRVRLAAAAYGQRQVIESSHFVVFAAKRAVTPSDVDEFLDLICSVREVPRESLNALRQMLEGDVVHGPRAAVAGEWAARQAYIALGNLMTSAALLGIDACPMEGFNPDQFDEILGLSVQGLHAVVACAVGYRASGDKYAELPKVRRPSDKAILRS